MATPGLGIDIGGISDVDSLLSYSDEKKSVAEAVIVSLSHGPGVLWWAPQRGFNLIEALHSDMTTDEIEQGIRNEAEAEERVESAEVTVSEPERSRFEVQCKLTLINNAGDVQLTLSVDQAGAAINAVIG
jgi:hypothetical protein